jgi:uncharacterized protein YkwD
MLVTGTSSAGTTLTSSEQEMASYINSARSARGISVMKKSAGLTDISRTHSRNMIRRGYIYHRTSSQLRYDLRSYRWSVAGENVGRATSVRAVFDAFMRSSSHRSNILYSKYKWVGVGIVWSGGRAWVTLTLLG